MHGASCPTAQFAKHNRVNRGFLTANKQESERDISAELSKQPPLLRGKNISDNMPILEAFIKLKLKCYPIRQLFMERFVGMLLHNFFPICYGWGLAVCRQLRKAHRQRQSAAFSHILGPVVKFNKVICLLCFYYNGAFLCCVVEYLEIRI